MKQACLDGSDMLLCGAGKPGRTGGRASRLAVHLAYHSGTGRGAGQSRLKGGETSGCLDQEMTRGNPALKPREKDICLFRVGQEKRPDLGAEWTVWAVVSDKRGCRSGRSQKTK